MKYSTHTLSRILSVAAACGLLLPLSCQREQPGVMGEAAELSFTATLEPAQTKAPAAVTPSWELLPQQEYQTLPAGDTLWMRSSREPMQGAAPMTKASPYSGESATPGEVGLSSTVSLGVVAYKYASSGAAQSSWTLQASVKAYCDASRTGASNHDMAAVGALPNANPIAGKHDALLNVGQELAIPFLVLLLNGAHHLELIGNLIETLFASLASHTGIHIGPFKVLAICGILQVLNRAGH